MQGLSMQIWKLLFEIEPITDKQKAILGMAKEEINGYEATTLFELRNEFE